MKASALLFPLLLVGAASCATKEELPVCMGSCTVLSGRLLTSGSVPLRNVTATFQWKGQPNGFRRETHKKAVVATDANGRYRLSGFLTDAELADGYIQVVFSPDPGKYYLIGEPDFAFHRFKRDTLLSVPDYLIPRKAFVKFVVTNPSQIPGPYSYYADLSTCYGGNTVFSQNILGGGLTANCFGISTSPAYDMAADQPILVRQRKSGGYTVPNDTIIIPAGTTKTYTLTY